MLIYSYYTHTQSYPYQYSSTWIYSVIHISNSNTVFFHSSCSTWRTMAVPCWGNATQLSIIFPLVCAFWLWITISKVCKKWRRTFGDLDMKVTSYSLRFLFLFIYLFFNEKTENLFFWFFFFFLEIWIWRLLLIFWLIMPFVCRNRFWLIMPAFRLQEQKAGRNC